MTKLTLRSLPEYNNLLECVGNDCDVTVVSNDEIIARYDDGSEGVVVFRGPGKGWTFHNAYSECCTE